MITQKPQDLSTAPVIKGHKIWRPNLKYATSKWEASIIDVYEIIFDPLKHQPITLFEIGVFQGESMRYFREFFTHPDTKIVGLDREGLKGGSEPGDERFTVKQGDQSNLGVLQEIVNSFGPFDIIIDDASHAESQTVATFDALWPHVKEGGFYITEDYVPPRTFLENIIRSKQGKGFYSMGHNGFDDRASCSPLCIIKKTQNLITGLEF